MLIVGNALVSEDVLDKQFACQLSQCHGACCVKGDAGAPLEASEIAIIAQEMEKIQPFLSEEGKETIIEQGFHTLDPEGESVTVCRPEGECVFVVYEGLTAVCGIEKAYYAGQTTFKKPISCHLYPIRAKQYGEYLALNYHKWEICEPACQAGKAQQIPVYRFLKDALIRKMGEEWYTELAAVAADWTSNQHHR